MAITVAPSHLPALSSHQRAGVAHELTRIMQDVSERARERTDRLGEFDLVSQDVPLDVVRELEQQLWMIRAQPSS